METSITFILNFEEYEDLKQPPKRRNKKDKRRNKDKKRTLQIRQARKLKRKMKDVR